MLLSISSPRFFRGKSAAKLANNLYRWICFLVNIRQKGKIIRFNFSLFFFFEINAICCIFADEIQITNLIHLKL